MSHRMASRICCFCPDNAHLLHTVCFPRGCGVTFPKYGLHERWCTWAFDRRSSTVPARGLWERRPLIELSGNSDWLSRGCTARTLEWPCWTPVLNIPNPGSVYACKLH